MSQNNAIIVLHCREGGYSALNHLNEFGPWIVLTIRIWQNLSIKKARAHCTGLFRIVYNPLSQNFNLEVFSAAEEEATAHGVMTTLDTNIKECSGVIHGLNAIKYVQYASPE